VKFLDAGASYWQIPATSLDKVEKRKPGPKPTKKAAKKGAVK
jgi:hypothetical protein